MKLSWTAVAALLVGVMSGAGPAHADVWSDLVLASHNQARTQYGAPELTWDPALYADTVAWAKACKFQHSDPQGRYGENIYAVTDSNASINDAVAAWMQEASQYNYNNPTFSIGAGHFTQVVWKSTTQVTAAVADCPADTIFPGFPARFFVARYTPPGNQQGQFQQNVGPHE
ncbi:CAP family protein [Nocardia sp. NPDC057455]|uniref:CAP family protein n=1 Tax=Nocardia sp. NPDC057455 TaxID=3346138 RepID=UPI00366C98C7